MHNARITVFDDTLMLAACCDVDLVQPRWLTGCCGMCIVSMVGVLGWLPCFYCITFRNDFGAGVRRIRALPCFAFHHVI